MQKPDLWQHIHTERSALAEVLADLDPLLWQHDTLCDGWSVHDIAAHVIAHPQIRPQHLPLMLARNLGRGYNAMIYREVKRLGARETREKVLDDFERFHGSRRHVPGTTAKEALIDVLVHTQDIVRPLGLRHQMPPDAALVAGRRALTQSLLMGWKSARGLRLVATDIDWTHGEGPTVAGPMQELLMLICGRAPDAALLTGDGRELLRSR
jgi:uncharacterized protein (TIGR03083 family)